MALVVGTLKASFSVGVILALVAVSVDVIYHWRRRAATAVWRRGQRGDRRMAKILRYTVEWRGYRVLTARTVPGHGTVDQLVIGPTSVWLIHNEAWHPDTEIAVHGDRLFIGRTTDTQMVTALRERAREAGELLSRELGTEIVAETLVAAHCGRLPRAPLSAEGIVVLRPWRVPRRLLRRRNTDLDPQRVEAVTRAAIRVLLPGGRMFPPDRG